MKTFKPIKRFSKLIFVVSKVCYNVWETLFGWHVACENIRQPDPFLLALRRWGRFARNVLSDHKNTVMLKSWVFNHSTAEIVSVQSQLVKNNEILVYQSGISLNLRTGPTGQATLFNQWEGALVFIKIQIKISTVHVDQKISEPSKPIQPWLP